MLDKMFSDMVKTIKDEKKKKFEVSGLKPEEIEKKLVG